jgi:hypothetical protein
MEYLSIGSTPSDEECTQVGTDNYHERAIKECTAYKNQLERVFKDIPDGCYFSIKGFPHDFGTYYEVVVKYNEDNGEATEFACNVENNSPTKWDAEAKKELGITGSTL